MAKVAIDSSLDGLALAELVRRKEVAPSELVEAAIERVEAVNPRLNAVVDKLYDRARRQAQTTLPAGPFRGVPFLMKEILGEEEGTVTTAGSRFFEGRLAPRDSEVARRFRAAGLVSIGKTNAPELGILPVTEPALYGPARNPWSLEHTTGGSSGGSAAAVAARLVPLAHANDGGGSIRIPASCCGVFGLKPTRGRTPLGPDRGEEWHGLALDNSVTVSVRDSAALLDAIAGPDAGAPYVAPPAPRPYLEEVGREPGRLRIGFTTKSALGRAVHPECAAAVKDAAALCAQLGHDVEESEPPFDRQVFSRAFLTLVAGEVAGEVLRRAEEVGRRPRQAELELPTWLLVRCGTHFSAADLASAIVTLHQVARRQAAWFARFDLLLTPTLALPPVKVGELSPTRFQTILLKLLRRTPSRAVLRRVLDQLAGDLATEFAAFTPIANVTGQPAMSVPLFWSQAGLPIGSHFVGRFGEEGTLFRLAAQLEQARPWAKRKPPVVAA